MGIAMAVTKPLMLLLLMAGPVVSAEPMSVCEVLADLSALHGKQIKIRGIWRKGDAGQALWASVPCEKRTVRDRWEFIDAIQVGPVHGPQSAAPYYRELRSIESSQSGMAIFVTMLGVLNAPDHFDVSTDSGIERPRAFGARFAAQLGFVDVTDFKAVRLPPETVDEVQRRLYLIPKRVK
jgi:hypothetical protein